MLSSENAAGETEALRRALAYISIRAITGQHFETLEYKNREFAKIEALAMAALKILASPTLPLEAANPTEEAS